MARSIYARPAISVGLLAGCAALVLGDVGSRVSEWRLMASLAALPGVSAGRITRDAGTGRLVLQGVDVVRGGWHVSIGRLALADGAPDLALVGRAEAQAATIAADDIRIVGERNVYRVPHLEMRGTTLTASDLTALMDVSAPETVAERLAKFSAAVVKAPTAVIEADGAGPAPADAIVTIQDITLTDVVGGRIGSLSALRTDIVPRAPDQAPRVAGDAPFQIGRIRADVIDLPLALKLADGSRSDAKASLGLLIGNLSIEAVAVQNGGVGDVGTITVGALRSGAIRARPLPDTLDRTASLINRPLDSLTPRERQALADGVSDVFRSYEIDHVEIDDLSFKDEVAKRGFALGRFAIDGVGGARALSMAIDAMALDGPEAKLSLDHLALWGVDQAGAIALARRGVVPPAPGHIEINLKANPVHTAFALDSLTIAVPASNGTGNTQDRGQTLVQIPELSLGGGTAPVGDAVQSTAHMRVVYVIPRSFADPNLNGLTKLGLDRLDVRFDSELAFNAAAKRLSVDKMALQAMNLGRMTLGAVFGNIDPQGVQSDADARARAALAVSLERLTLRFDNDGVVEKVLPILAASAKVSVPVFKASLEAQAEVSIAQAMGDSPAAVKLTRAISTFLNDPRNITLAVTIPGGLTAETAQAASDPAALIGAMTIDATADQ